MWFSWRGVLVFLGVCSILTGVLFSLFGKGGDFRGEAPNFHVPENPFFRKIILDHDGFVFPGNLRHVGNLYHAAALSGDPARIGAKLGQYPGGAFTAIRRVHGLLGRVGARIGWVPAIDHERGLSVGGDGNGSSGCTDGIMAGGHGVFLQPIVAVCFFPPGFAALSAIGPASTRNVAVSMTMPVAFLVGGGAIPMGIGLMGDVGSFALGVSCTGGLILSGALLALLYKPWRREVRDSP